MSYLCVLNGLDCESLAGCQSQREGSVSQHVLFLDLCVRAAMVSSGENRENKRDTSIAFCALFGSNSEAMLVQKKRRCMSKMGRPLSAPRWQLNRSAALSPATDSGQAADQPYCLTSLFLIYHHHSRDHPLPLECQRLRQMHPQK
jgi:hypothetical protein